MSEVISIHTGQAGNQIGNICWELYCNEHAINYDGKMDSSLCHGIDDSFKSFFSESKSGTYIPRALFADLECDSIDDIRTGSIRKLFKNTPYQLLNGEDDSSNIYARGYYSIGKSLVDIALENIRKIAEQCNSVSGFLIYHSLGGGTGSGFTSLLLNQLANEYKDVSKFEISIFPSKTFGTSVLEPYNTILSAHSTIDKSDCSFLFDNDSLFRICKNRLDLEYPNMTIINRTLIHAISSITAPLRFDDKTGIDIFKEKNQLIPFPRLHFPICSYGPLNNMEGSGPQYYEGDLTNIIFDKELLMFNCNPLDGKYMSCSCFYRGDLDFKKCIESIHTVKKLEFVKSIRNEIKLGFIHQQPTISFSFLEKYVIKKYLSMACMIANSTSVSKNWKNLGHQFDLMYEKRAFIHWFINEGMEESEFKDSRNFLTDLLNEYNDVSRTE